MGTPRRPGFPVARFSASEDVREKSGTRWNVPTQPEHIQHHRPLAQFLVAVEVIPGNFREVCPVV